MDLAVLAEGAVARLNFNIEGILNASDPVQEADYAEAVCQGYELVAICELLLDAEVDEFFHCLIRSGQTRLWLLERAREEPVEYPTSKLKSSNLNGFFAALAAGQWSLAGKIAALSPQNVDPSSEYPDDFLYAHFLHRYVLGDDPEVLGGIADLFEASLEGDASPRLDLCRFLLFPTPDGAEARFEALLGARSAEIAHFEEVSVQAADSSFQIRKAVFLEGLAWLKILGRSGLRIEKEYPYCPSIARIEEYQPFVVTTFPGVPLD